MIPQIFSNTCSLKSSLLTLQYILECQLTIRLIPADCCCLLVDDRLLSWNWWWGYNKNFCFLAVEFELITSQLGAKLNDQYRYKSVWLMFNYQACIQILATYVNIIQLKWNHTSRRISFPVNMSDGTGWYLGNKT